MIPGKTVDKQEYERFIEMPRNEEGTFELGFSKIVPARSRRRNSVIE
jgi:hypothetical protein